MTRTNHMLIQHRVEYFPLNKQGRDFVVGDLHGAYALLFEAMQAVNFSPGRDRLFSVGDLIDRGPDSARVCEILAIPGFHAVRGNHEGMLLDLVEEAGIDCDVLLPHHVKNGLGWWLETALAQRGPIIAALRQLPVAIQVSTSRGEVGLVHADVPPGLAWPEFLGAIERGDEEVIECALWSRARHERGDGRGVAGIGRVLVGHVPMRDGVERLGNVFFIDTGAVFASFGRAPGAGLTIAQLAAATGMLTGAKPLPTLLNPINPEFLPDCPYNAAPIAA